MSAIRSGDDPDNSLSMELWNKNAGMIRKACGNFSEKLEGEDARQECYFAFLDAVKDYEPGAGMTFAGYLYKRCMWHLSRYATDHGDVLRIPENRRQMIRQYMRFTRQYYQIKGREPSDLTLYACLGLSPDQLRQLREDLQAVKVKSLDTPLSDDPEGGTLSDLILDEGKDVEAAATDPVFIQERRRAVWSAVDSLKRADAEAIRMCYQNGLTYQQAGAAAGVSGERIRARLVHGFRELRKPKYKELRGFIDLSPVYGRAIQGGTASFNRTWTSATEKTALWILEAEERWQREREELDRMLERNRREREEYDRRKAAREGREE